MLFSFFFLLASFQTGPLLWHLTTSLPSDADDPSLNASILHWGATHVPFSPSWWNAPQYYPTSGVAAFTENLVGILPFSAPVDWLTGSTVAAYNIAFFLTWPLSAWATYLLVFRLTRRQDAALVSGLAFGFMPYRVVEISHIQMLATEWLPLMLLGLHGYFDDRRLRWLWLFGAAWILSSLSNGYFMLFGAVLVGLWLVYFGSTRRARPAASRATLAWVISSLPLFPILLKYRTVHEQFGLYRFENEIEQYGAQLASWGRTPSAVWFWGRLLPDGKDDLFPGAAAPLVVMMGIAILLWRRRNTRAGTGVRSLGALLIAVLCACTCIAVVAMARGPFDLKVGGLSLFRVSDLNLELNVILICGIWLVAITPSMRAAVARRSPLVFYTATALLFALFALGPKIRVDETVLLSRTPYWWLMRLPGFDEIRVPPRFWMLGTLSLSVAAGITLAHLPGAKRTVRSLLLGVVAGFVLLEGWTPSMRMAQPPSVWTRAEPSAERTPILELPIGAGFDYPATFRAGEHGRRVVNGVSGYNPPYYLALVAGLQDRDPLTLKALSAFGPLDAVVTRAGDPDDAIRRYVEEVGGASVVHADETHAVLRIPRGSPEPEVGPALNIGLVHASVFDEDAALMHDGKMTTGWHDFSNQPDQRITVDLGTIAEVGAVSQAIGDFFVAFPRHLVIELSLTGADWTTVWDGQTNGPFLLSSVRAPRVADMRFVFAPQQTRYVRLRQLDPLHRLWRVSEIRVHAPMR